MSDVTHEKAANAYVVDTGVGTRSVTALRVARRAIIGPKTVDRLHNSMS
jgi:hypothetical protein